MGPWTVGQTWSVSVFISGCLGHLKLLPIKIILLFPSNSSPHSQRASRAVASEKSKPWLRRPSRQPFV